MKLNREICGRNSLGTLDPNRCVEWGLTICDKNRGEIQPGLLKVHNIMTTKNLNYYTKNSKFQPHGYISVQLK